MSHLRTALAGAALAAFVFTTPAFAQIDSDGDGVSDGADAFPCNPASSSAAYVPALGQHGLLMFEDYWPVRLDDDYNDVVLAYNYAYEQNAGGQTVKVVLTLDMLAAGGVIDMGLGLVFPLPPAAISRIAATQGGAPVTVASAVEGASGTRLTLTGDVRATFFPAADQQIINADPAAPRFDNAAPLVVTIDLVQPTVIPGSAPYDLYIFRSSTPSHEVHRPEFCGTSNFDGTLFGTGVDASTPGRCFVDGQGLPAGLHVPQVVDYPKEETNIALLYPRIVPWAASGGATDTDWFLSPTTTHAYPNPVVATFEGSGALLADTSCPCPSGFAGTAGTCVDADECGNQTDNCHANAICSNTIGSFTCACLSGFAGDGVSCLDTDECAQQLDDCDANAVCTNLQGGFSCACNAGYTGDGVTCVDVDECGNQTDNCHANATCTNTQGSFSCTCNSGFTGDGVSCTSTLGQPGNPASTCRTLHASNPSLPSGVYWIDPNGGSTSDAFQAECDMTTDGGGWTRVITAGGSAVITDGAVNNINSGTFKFSNTVINQILGPERRMFVRMGSSQFIHFELVRGGFTTRSQAVNYRFGNAGGFRPFCTHSAQETNYRWFFVKAVCSGSYPNTTCSCVSSNFENAVYDSDGFRNRDGTVFWPQTGWSSNYTVWAR